MGLTTELQEAMTHLAKASSLLAASLASDGNQLGRTSVLVAALDSVTTARQNIDRLSTEPMGQRLVREYFESRTAKTAGAD